MLWVVLWMKGVDGRKWYFQKRTSCAVGTASGHGESYLRLALINLFTMHRFTSRCFARFGFANQKTSNSSRSKITTINNHHRNFANMSSPAYEHQSLRIWQGYMQVNPARKDQVSRQWVVYVTEAGKMFPEHHDTGQYWAERWFWNYLCEPCS